MGALILFLVVTIIGFPIVVINDYYDKKEKDKWNSIPKDYSHIEKNKQYIKTKYSLEVANKIIGLQYWNGMTEQQLDDMIMFRYTTKHCTPNYMNTNLLMSDTNFKNHYSQVLYRSGYDVEYKTYKNGDNGKIKIYGGSKNSGNYFTFVNGIMKLATVRYDYKFP